MILSAIFTVLFITLLLAYFNAMDSKHMYKSKWIEERAWGKRDNKRVQQLRVGLEKLKTLSLDAGNWIILRDTIVKLLEDDMKFSNDEKDNTPDDKCNHLIGLRTPRHEIPTLRYESDGDPEEWRGTVFWHCPTCCKLLWQWVEINTKEDTYKTKRYIGNRHGK